MPDVPDRIQGDVTKAWEKIDAIVEQFYALLPNIVIAIIVFSIFIGLSKFFQFGVSRWTTRHRSNIGTIIGRIGKWIILFLGFLIAISIVTPSVGAAQLFGALGIGSVAIGFAFKDVLQNFLAGILILLREPFRVGDAIEFGEYSGVVEDIETRATLIKTYDGRRVIIPNGTLFTSSVVVMTAHPHRRKSARVGIAYKHAADEVQEILLQAVRDVEGVLSDPAPFVRVAELGDSALVLEVFWWARNDDFGSVGSKVLGAIKKAMMGAKIDMPFPTQKLVIAQGATPREDIENRDGISPRTKGE